MQLEHANITVNDIDETLRFLSVVFPESSVRGSGALNSAEDTQEDTQEAKGRWVHFGTDEHYIALQQNARPEGRRDTTYRNDGINHIGFVVTGLDEIVSRANDAGYELSPVSAMKGHPHRRRAYFFDGNGIEWELVEYLSDDSSERNDYKL